MPDSEPSIQKRKKMPVRIIAGFIIFIAVVVVMPTIIRAPSASIKGCMRSVQIAAESYATDTGGKYPRTYTELARYLPGGSNTLMGKPGVLLNPATGKPDLLVVNDALSTSEKIQSIESKGSSIGLWGVRPGQIVYSCADSGNSYAIAGVKSDGTLVGGAGGNALVLSNQ